jgi:tellurite resistance protein TerC
VIVLPVLPGAGVLGAASSNFADIDVPIWVWGAFVALLVALLSVDLALHRDNHTVSTRRAITESAAWVACGLGFSVVVLVAWGGQAFGEYMSGYVIEKSLSVDNVFVWAIIFSTFAIPARYQHRVLFWGIFGALTMRAAFIMGGSALISRFWWMLPVFGAVLLFSGVKVIRHRDDEGTHGHDRAVRLLGRVIPVRPSLAGQRFFLRENGRLVATPLLAALVVIEVTDVVFAVDSVPAILAVSREPFIVFASNAFAILGLRAMYFLLFDARRRFHYLSHALGAILVFVGVKMAVSHWWHMPTSLSLGVILVILAAAVVFSLRKQRAEAARAAVAPADSPAGEATPAEAAGPADTVMPAEAADRDPAPNTPAERDRSRT